MGNKNYYDILGISKNASEAEIKKAFHKLSLKWHPDKWTNSSDEEKKNAEDKFKEIAEAYSILSDTEKREKYDLFGTVDGHGDGGFSQPDMEDIMSMFKSFGGFGSSFGSSFGGGFGRSRENLNARFTLTVGLDDLYYGREKTFKYNRIAKCHTCNGKGSTSENGVEVCQYCNGSGMITNTRQRGNTIIQNMTQCPHCNGVGKTIKDPCKTCGGTGQERIEDEMTIKIPSGVVSGATMAIPGRGNFAMDGSGVCGNLELTFNVMPYGKFVQNGQYDIFTEIDVPIIDCITGTKTEIEFIDGSHKTLNVPAGTKDGDIVTIEGLGLLDARYGRRGNLYINIRQKMPNKITNDELKLLKELKTYKDFA